ncbi:MAG: excinuclease ABC subunit UvrA [bacterium]
MSITDKIIIKGAREHNLKNIDLEIPRNKLVVITGLSGSGKSSLAFDTLYAEGQRRYVESLSAYARQFLEQMEKPDVDLIEGLSPAISIEQKTTSKNPRSTVGTVTEIYDYLRLLFARIGKPFCYNCRKEIKSQTVQQIIEQVLSLPLNTKLYILSPIVRGRKGEYRKIFEHLRKKGFVRIKVDGEIKDLNEDIVLDKNKKHDLQVIVDRLVIKENIRKRLADSIEIAINLAEGLVIIEILEDETSKKDSLLFSENLACPDCGVSYPELSPRMFSFNNPHGACPSCDGLGYKIELDPELIIPDGNKSITNGAIEPWGGLGGGIDSYYKQKLGAVANYFNIDINKPFEEISKEKKDIILYGTKEKIKFKVENKEKTGKFEWVSDFEGVIPNLERRFRETTSNYIRGQIQKYMRNHPCSQCNGERLRKESLAIKINSKNIIEFSKLSIQDAYSLFSNLELNKTEVAIAEKIIKEIKERLGFLINVGLGYLTLDRPSATLSGGEGQRIRLATQIGSSLVGVLYILDEPSIGLHQRDNTKLLNTLTALRDIGNTVIVVEHDAETILKSDFVIDLGPGAGIHGGNIVALGHPTEILANKNSLTGQYLSGEKQISIPQKRRLPKNKRFISIKGASLNNLKDIDVDIPLGIFTCITGVSGSGKSSLIIETLYKAIAQHIYHIHDKPGGFKELKGLEWIDKVIDIDQSPIGRTPRSNPATYTGLFTFIRELFTSLPESKIRGYKAGRYSFNVKGGRCESCQGDGIIKIEMHFLPDVYIMCETCKGKRYNLETLDILYKGKNIAEVLDMTVGEAKSFFINIPALKTKLQTLDQVGLSYLRLGQAATTLSGGEAQRIKLAKELSKRSTGKTLYILDEPTTGLHFADIERLLDVLNKLTDEGNTVIVIEHNLDVIKTADYLIDLGPEGGDGGGRILVQGTPEEVAKCEGSYTGQYLKKVLHL